MKHIHLTQGQVAIVSYADFEWLMQWKWYAWWNPSTKSYYARRTIRLANGKRRLLFMHRLILGLEYGDTREGDHINHDTLDDRRENLRVVTRQENTFNQSGVKGYCWNHRAKKFQAQITLDGKQHFLGYYDTTSDAHAAYLAAKARYHRIG
jgi:hypothetical protein